MIQVKEAKRSGKPRQTQIRTAEPEQKDLEWPKFVISEGSAKGKR